MPDHDAETRKCPYCKEDIKADAIRCKHCHADIRPGVRAGVGGCCGNGGGGRRLRPTRRTKMIARDVAYRDSPPLIAACHGCPLTDTDGSARGASEVATRRPARCGSANRRLSPGSWSRPD
jgi:hypothetical protein